MKRMPLVLVLLVGISGAPGVVSAAGVSPSSATAAELERAQALFLQGKAELDANRHQPALDAFRASYDTVASPNSHLFVARCLSTLGDVAGAYREYGLVADEARQAAATDKKYEATRAAAEAEQTELRGKVGFLLVRVEGATSDVAVTVAETSVPMGSLALPVPVNPGLIEVRAATPAGGSAESLVMIAPGEHKEVSLALAPSDAPSPMLDDAVAADAEDPDQVARKRLRTSAYVAAGVGAAGFLTFAVAGSMARSQYSTLQDECAGPCPRERQGDIDAGRRSQLIANVGLAVGAIGLGTGTVLYLVSRPKAQGDTAAATSPPMTAEVAAGPSWLGVRGTFR